jgi:hypothetical protein
MSTSRVQVQQRYIMANSLPAGNELEKPSIPSELSVTDVLSSIYDKKALSIFKAVALSVNYCSSILITKIRTYSQTILFKHGKISSYWFSQKD